MFGIIVFTGHQMSATEIQPLYLWKPTGKFGFEMLQCAFQLIRRRFTVTMAMEAFNSLRQCIGQQIGCYPKTCAGCTWIIKFCFHFRVFGIYTNTTRNTTSFCHHHRIKTLELLHRVESDMTAATHYFRKILFRISWRICMCLTSEFFQCQTGFIHRTCRRMVYIFTEYRERTPHGKRLESKNNLHSRPVGYVFYQTQVLS